MIHQRRHTPVPESVPRHASPARSKSGVQPRFEGPPSSPPEAISARPQSSLLADLGSVLCTLDYMSGLRQLTRMLGTRIAGGCVVDVSVNGVERRLVHAPVHAEPSLTCSLHQVVARARVTEGIVMTPFDDVATAAAQSLGARWLGAAALVYEGIPVGTLTLFGTGESPSLLSSGELQQLADTAAATIGNGQLYEATLAKLRRRDEMLATVAHDLKNPLSVILMTASRMLETTTATSSATGVVDRLQLEAIQRSGHRMRRLVMDLLDLAALDGHAMTMRPERCSVHEMVQDVLEMFAPLASAAGVRLVDEVSKGLPDVWADPDRIGQVLSNIVGNAIKFTNRSGSVTVRTIVVDDSVRVVVVDTGTGISADELGRVSERFWQNAKTASKGSGLGLSICKGILEQSGSTLAVESELGVGTQMSFTLPVARFAKALRGMAPRAALTLR